MKQYDRVAIEHHLIDVHDRGTKTRVNPENGSIEQRNPVCTAGGRAQLNTG